MHQKQEISQGGVWTMERQVTEKNAKRELGDCEGAELTVLHLSVFRKMLDSFVEWGIGCLKT